MADYDYPGDDAHWERIRKNERERAESVARQEGASEAGFLPGDISYSGKLYGQDAVRPVMEAVTCGTCFAVVSTHNWEKHVQWHDRLFMESVE